MNKELRIGNTNRKSEARKLAERTYPPKYDKGIPERKLVTFVLDCRYCTCSHLEHCHPEIEFQGTECKHCNCKEFKVITHS